MGVKQLWNLLQGEGLVERRQGISDGDLPPIVREVDGKVVAVDLAMWVMQADQQVALLPHFSREERSIKVAFERALQWLRHGCIPVIVVEGRAPEEKRGAQQQRWGQRGGYGGGRAAASRGPSQFTRLGSLVASVLEEMGLPVFHAPGEAEAVCAALVQAGCCDAAATFDSDVLLYGAETVYQTLRLSTTDPKSCEMAKCCLADVRARLGLAAGGPAALSVIALLAGCDYDLDGAQGVGSVGGLAVAQHLLQGDQDDSRVLERLAHLLAQPPNAHLLSLEKCTGCGTCGHEGGRKGKVKRHTAKNPCPCCPPSQDGCCVPRPGAGCSCAFHASEGPRRIERIAERVRRDPGFMREAEAALGVFERQGREAAEYVIAQLQKMGAPLGGRLGWLRRPSVSGVWAILQARCPGLGWDLPTLRSKMLPALLEWDLGHPGAQVEFVPAEVQKLHGQKARGQDSEAYWRYVLKWERTSTDLEQLGILQVRPKRPRAKPGTVPAAGSQVAAAGGGLLPGGDGDDDVILSQLASQPLSQMLSQPITSQPLSQSQAAGRGESGWCMELSTQAGCSTEGEEEPPPVPMEVADFDERWLKEQPAEHRAVRRSAVQRLWPQLVQAYQDKLVAGAAPRRTKASNASMAAAGAAAAAAAAASGAATAAGGRGTKTSARSSRARKADGKAAAASSTVAAAGPKLPPAQAAGAGAGVDISRLLNLHASSAAAAAASSGKHTAPPPRHYGLGPGLPRRDQAPGEASTAGAQRQLPLRSQSQRQQEQQEELWQLRQEVELLLGGSGSSEQEEGERGGGGRGGEEEEGGQEKREGLRLAQYESPEKKIKTWSASSPSDRGYDSFEVLLSSPETGFMPRPSSHSSPACARPASPLVPGAAGAAAAAGSGPRASRRLFSQPNGGAGAAVLQNLAQPARQQQQRQRQGWQHGEGGCGNAEPPAGAAVGVTGSGSTTTSSGAAGAAAAADGRGASISSFGAGQEQEEIEPSSDLLDQLQPSAAEPQQAQRQPLPSSADVLLHWQQPQAQRRARGAAQKGRGGSSAARGGQAPAGSARAAGTAATEHAPAGTAGAAAGKAAPKRGKPGLRAAAKSHATDIRGFLQHNHHQQQQPQQQQPVLAGSAAAAVPEGFAGGEDMEGAGQDAHRATEATAPGLGQVGAGAAAGTRADAAVDWHGKSDVIDLVQPLTSRGNGSARGMAAAGPARQQQQQEEGDSDFIDLTGDDDD